MPDKQKFSDEDMAKLKELQDRFNNIILQFGQIDIEIIKTETETERLKNLKSKLTEDYKKLKSEEQALAGELTKKYGAGVLDPKTGDFTPQENKGN
jgi:chromosome segregation ATPase